MGLVELGKEFPGVSAGLKDLYVNKGEGNSTRVLCVHDSTRPGGFDGPFLQRVRRADEGRDAKIQLLCCFPENLWPWFGKQGREDGRMSDLAKPSSSLLLHTGSQGIMWGMLPLLAVCLEEGTGGGKVKLHENISVKLEKSSRARGPQ